MAKPSTPPILAQIRSSTPSSDQVLALKSLKNDIIGHQQKKEMWVGLGVIEPLVRVINPRTHSRTAGKDQLNYKGGLGEEEMVRLQALCIIGSLAYGGPAFLAPLHSASTLPPLLSSISPSNNHPQVILAALRALSNLTDSTSLAASPLALNASLLGDSIFSEPHINSLIQIISQDSSDPVVRHQINIVASLISRLCREERHQLCLAGAGILDALATKLAGIIISQGLVIPGVDVSSWPENLPLSAPQNCDVANILEAIAVVIGDSRFRASQLVYSSAITAVFPVANDDDPPMRTSKAAGSAFSSGDLSYRQSRLNIIDFLLPRVPVAQSKNAFVVASAFPPLGSQGSFEELVPLGRPKNPAWVPNPTMRNETGSILQEINIVDGDDTESPLIPYLIWLTRSSRGLERLMAASLLAVLYRAGLANKTRETILGLLVVPLLVQLLEDESPDSANISDAESVIVRRSIRERTPSVLANLIVDSEYLQKTAYEAGVIGKLAKILKTAYEPVLDVSESRTWSPTSNLTSDVDDPSPSQSMRLGPAGHSPLLVHRIKVRESTLRAIAALVPFKDEYRKALIDQSVVPYIVESLKSFPDKPSSKASDRSDKNSHAVREDGSVSHGYGVHPISVLVAACGAVRHLSRSVSILRTTLIDNGVVMPVFTLLRHPDIDVQIAATAAVCNLVMDFSPMRETISAAGVLKILCEHAHSGNVKLRLNALWALKHLVQSAGNDVKKTCLEELGQGWLIQLICNDTEDEVLSTTNPGTDIVAIEHEEDIQMDQSGEGDEIWLAAESLTSRQAMPSDLRQDHASRPRSNRGTSAPSAYSRLATLRDLEMNPTRKARKDDIAVQEQGLDFIRNLIGGFNNVGTSETSEMIDFLLAELGQDQIFEILASKLRPKVLNPFNRSFIAPEARVIPPQAEIIAAVEYILVHMAASVPRHRQLVISQAELLKLLVPQFTHPNKEVRLALCWLVINLTWVDDAQDTPPCVQRAQELKKLGFLSKLEALEHDCELDVRERAKTAVWQMKQGY